jgi:hypothetical protein
MPSTNGTGNTIQNAIVRILSAQLHIVQQAAAVASAAAVYNGHPIIAKGTVGACSGHREVKPRTAYVTKWTMIPTFSNQMLVI